MLKVFSFASGDGEGSPEVEVLDSGVKGVVAEAASAVLAMGSTVAKERDSIEGLKRGRDEAMRREVDRREAILADGGRTQRK